MSKRVNRSPHFKEPWGKQKRLAIEPVLFQRCWSALWVWPRPPEHWFPFGAARGYRGFSGLWEETRSNLLESRTFKPFRFKQRHSSMCSLAFNITAKHLHLTGDFSDRGAPVKMRNLACCLWLEAPDSARASVGGRRGLITSPRHITGSSGALPADASERQIPIRKTY